MVAAAHPVVDLQTSAQRAPGSEVEIHTAVELELIWTGNWAG